MTLLISGQYEHLCNIASFRKLILHRGLPTSTQAEHLQQVIDNVADDTSDLETSIRSNLGVPLPLHISLSCTLPVLTEHRSAFLAAVEDALKNLRAQLEPFTIRLQDCVWAANFERNRWFLALIAKSLKGAELEVLLNVCNEVVRSFDMMALYPTLKSSTDRHSKFERAESISKSKNPVAGPTDTDDSFEKSPFHFSIASTVHPVLSKEDSLALVDINDEVMNRVRGMKIAIDKVKVKIGNAVHSIPLSCPPEDATQRKFFS